MQPNPLTAGGWSTATFLTTGLAGAIIYLSLTRLLTPADFGLMAEANLAFSVFVLLSGLNLAKAFLRTAGDATELAKLTFWLMLLAGLGGVIACAVSGLFLAWLYRDNRLVTVLALLAPGLLLVALGALPHAVLTRQLDFRRRLLPTAGAVILSGLLAVMLAWLGAGYFSLILYAITGLLINTLLIWLVVQKHGVGKLSFKALIINPPVLKTPLTRQLLGFGIGATAGELAGFIRGNLDIALGGLWLGTAGLGVYNVAALVAGQLANAVSSFFGNMSYAALARLAAEPAHSQKLTQFYLCVNRLVLLVALPLFGGAVIVREEIIAIFYDARWQAASQPLLPLLLLAWLTVATAPSGALILALGHSRWYASGQLLGLGWGVVVIGAATVVTNAFARAKPELTTVITALGWATLLAEGLVSLLWPLLAWRLLGLNWRTFYEVLRLPLIIALITLLATMLATLVTRILSLAALITLLAAILVAASTFLVTACWQRQQVLSDLAYLQQELPVQNNRKDLSP